MAETDKLHGIDEQVDQVLEDIEANSSFAVRKHLEADDIDPADIHPQAHDVDIDPLEEELAPAEAVDELDGEIDAPQPVETIEEPQPDIMTEERYERAMAGRRRLRTVLIVAIVILVALAAAIGVLVWQSALSPNVTPSDPEGMASVNAGTGDVSFEPVENAAIPKLTAVFGKKISAAQKKLGSSVKLSSKAKKANDNRVKGLKKIYEGTVVDDAGVKIADIGIGVNKKKKVVYAYCLFDLDALEVADATLEELTSSDVVPASLLKAVGVSDAALANATLTVADGKGASSSTETVTFKGGTAAEKPVTWELAETCTQASAESAVIRTALAELY